MVVQKDDRELMRNILSVDLDFKGQDVYVVGSGPKAAPYMIIPETQHEPIDIPLHAKVVACNKGIFCRATPTVWLCATPALAQCDWFNKQMRKYGSMPKAMAKVCKPLIAGREGEWLKNYEPFTHYFRPNGSLWSHVKRDPVTNKVKGVYPGFGCTKGYLRGGASAVARGLQLAWFNKAARCILIGADMKGIEYFDGTINKFKPRSLDGDGKWIELTYFNALIDWVKARDMDVVSLTPTALNVEVIDATA